MLGFALPICLSLLSSGELASLTFPSPAGVRPQPAPFSPPQPPSTIGMAAEASFLLQSLIPIL